jgi:hypothetical protein
MFNLFKKILPALKSIFITPAVAVASVEVFKTYIRFDINHPELITVENAELHLIVGYNTGGTTHTVEVYGLDDLHAGENWAETSITWNNGPANDVDNDFTAADVTLLGSFTVTSSDIAGTKKIFTSAGLITWLNLDTNRVVTVMLRRTDSNFSSELYFASKEHTTYDGPKLVINQTSLNLYTTGKEAPTIGYQNLYSHGF